MSTDGDRRDGQEQNTEGDTSLDSSITTKTVDRRSFLTRTAVAGSLALGTVLAAACGDDPDHCDSDAGTDSDTGENADAIGEGTVDSCDSD